MPWMRERLPLVSSASSLVAIADLWIDADFAARGGQARPEAGVDRPAANLLKARAGLSASTRRYCRRRSS